MSEYKHRLTLAVPKALMVEANQLALMVGESANDVNTFTEADWTDESGNLYAVCSTISKPVVLKVLGKGLSEKLTGDADYQIAKQALDKVVILESGVKANPKSITLAIDIEPTQALKQMVLTKLSAEMQQEQTIYTVENKDLIL